MMNPWTNQPRGGFSVSYTNVSATGQFLAADGVTGAPSYSFTSQPNTGFKWRTSSVDVVSNGVTIGVFFGGLTVVSTGFLGFSSGAPDVVAADTILVRDGVGIIAQKNGNADQIQRTYGANGGYIERGSVSELLTLSTVGVTTDTAANLLPANSRILSVTARITTTITTATDWKLGDATTAGRFTAANATLVSGTTTVGLVHIDVTGAGGPRQTAAAKLRVTTTGTPGAGAIRITTYYETYVPATS